MCRVRRTFDEFGNKGRERERGSREEPGKDALIVVNYSRHKASKQTSDYLFADVSKAHTTAVLATVPKSEDATKTSFCNFFFFIIRDSYKRFDKRQSCHVLQLLTLGYTRQCLPVDAPLAAELMHVTGNGFHPLATLGSLGSLHDNFALQAMSKTANVLDWIRVGLLWSLSAT